MNGLMWSIRKQMLFFSCDENHRSITKVKKKSREKNILKRRVFNYQNLQLSKSSSVNCCVVSHRKLTWMRTESVLFPFIKMIPTSTSTLFNKNIDYNRVACKIAIANLGGLKFIFGFKTLIWLLLKQYTLYHTGVFFFFPFFFLHTYCFSKSWYSRSSPCDHSDKQSALVTTTFVNPLFELW